MPPDAAQTGTPLEDDTDGEWKICGPQGCSHVSVPKSLDKATDEWTICGPHRCVPM